MTISRIELQGQITNAHDFTNIKHHEDNKGMLQQANITRNNEQAVEVKLHHVTDAESTSNNEKRFDAKEEGSNQYHGDGGRNKKSKNDNRDGKVILKAQNQHGFDLKI